MQNTRLNTLLTQVGDRGVQWLRNPWRRLSSLLLGLFIGFFFASGVSSTTGQLAIWDISAALLALLSVEIISRLFYNRVIIDPRRPRRPFVIDVLNAAKMGFTYGLFLEAFKLNS